MSCALYRFFDLFWFFLVFGTRQLQLPPSHAQFALAAVGRALSPAELAEMINKANPEVDGNERIERLDFLALMAQAEFSGLFLDAFSLLDTEDNGWVEATALWTMMDELVDPASSSGAASGVFSAEKLRAIKRRFDVGDDGHINYGSFVRLMLDEDSEDYKPEYV